MAYTTTPTPGQGETHQVVITIIGPKTTAEFERWKRELLEAVAHIGAKIGVRGTVETRSGTYVYPPGQDPRK